YFKQSCETDVIYKLVNLECIVNPERVENVSCRIKAINWNKAVAVMDCDLKVPMYKMIAHLQVYKKNYSNKFQPFLINVELNFCDIISKRSFMVYGVIVWKLLKRFSNVNHSCPIGGHLRARDLFIDSRLLPGFPLGFYKVALIIKDQLNISQQIEHVGIINMYFQSMEAVNRTRNQQRR
ncbi:CG33919, partial [Drosophila busckii]